MEKQKWTAIKIIKTVWVAGGVIFTLWLFYSYQSQGVDSRLLQSNHKVTVKQTSEFYSFSPLAATNQVLVFYPGAMVETKAYVPLCRKLSESQIKVYLIKMPWRLASKGYKLPIALDLFSDTTKTYTLAGHSQGAKMAAQFVHENPGLIHRLVLIGTTHPRDISLAECSIPVLKIYGSKDGVAPEGSILANRSKLPDSTKWVRIEGANHAQFGFYGFQLGDDQAEISREKQQAETIKHILAFVKE